MKKVTNALILILLLIITGCSNDEVFNYTYKGENDLWAVEYNIKETRTALEIESKNEYKSKCDNVLVVTYKNDISELSSIKNLEISYQSSTGGGKSNLEFNDNPPSKKTFTIQSSSYRGTIINYDEVIKVDINIDGSVQTIDLNKLK